MSQAVLFSIPQYVPDVTSLEVVTGYQVQGSSQTASSGFSGSFVDLPGSPFASNQNVVDTSTTASVTKLYRARPVLTVTQNNTVYTLDVPWSRPFTSSTPLFDYNFTAVLLPMLRATYLGDGGVAQTNGTSIVETTGAGNGLWRPDGVKLRFPLQYVENDDPIRVMDAFYRLTWTDSAGTAKSALADVDYSVDVRNGVVEFATAPLASDYQRFEFRKVDFVNDDLLLALKSAVDAIGTYGINGYSLHKQNNLFTMAKAIPNPDFADILCKLAVRNMREGLTEQALRSTMSWRDSGSAYDPYPDRALQFLVQKLDLNDKAIQRQCNGWIRSNTQPLYRGDFEMTFDMSQLSPVSISMFEQFGMYAGSVGPGLIQAFWI